MLIGVDDVATLRAKAIITKAPSTPRKDNLEKVLFVFWCLGD
jgi:hypothetical protein